MESPRVEMEDLFYRLISKLRIPHRSVVIENETSITKITLLFVKMIVSSSNSKFEFNYYYSNT